MEQGGDPGEDVGGRVTIVGGDLGEGEETLSVVDVVSSRE